MSNIFKLNWRDLVKGLVVVTLAALFYALIQLLPTFNIPVWLQQVLSVILGYLAKNLATDENGQLGGKI